ncbi:MAG TPA: SUMF1/EgtB/PvdO family nonheme iron enzyme [Rectinemataceae bacterium]|nr:SUMF1/EgtB/PvdO family nonheme iron enzyme [Rectinemataceae bacterium]
MDYLQSLEIQMAALQRKIRLLQDLRFFVETASAEELAGFGEELRSILTPTGQSLGHVLAGLLGAAGGGPSAHAGFSAPHNAAPTAPGPATGASAGGGTVAGLPPAPVPPAPVQPHEAAPGGAAAAGLLESALSSVNEAMRPIAGSTFVMGSDSGSDDEKPPHKVSLSAFRLCDHLTTNREYALFVRARPEWSKDRADADLRDDNYLSDWNGDDYPEGKDEHPVAYVSFYAAQAYASWLGKRLAREAEWECAARGGLVGKKYPNGDQMNDSLANLAKQYRGTTPVRQFAANGFGLFDMSGNLFEWTLDWFGPYPKTEETNPTGPEAGEFKVVRGGSWMSGAGALRVSARVDMDPVSCGQVGIRVADEL